MLNVTAAKLNIAANPIRPRQTLAGAVLICVIIGAMEFASLYLAKRLGMVSTIWPANGVLLAVLLNAPRRHWPYYLLAAAAANGISAHFIGYSAASCLRLPLISLVEISFAVYFLRAALGDALDLSEPSVLWRFALIAVFAAPLVSAALNAVLLILVQGQAGEARFVAAFFAHALGIITVAPLVLAYRRGELRFGGNSHIARKLLLGFAPLLVVTAAVFAQQRYPLLFMVYPPLVLSVVELGFAGGVLGMFCTTGIALGFTIAGHGPATLVQGADLIGRVIIVQLFLSVAAILVLALSAILAERDRAMQLLEQVRAQLADLATTDSLTGLANRRKLDEAIELELRRAASQGFAVSLLLLDVDQFKAYNDLYGHPAGDACLHRIAAVAARYARRAGDICARYGGEEFAVLLSPAKAAAATERAEQLRAEIEALCLDHAGNPEGGGIVTISIGVATVEPDFSGISANSLITQADEALYAAKREGRNRVRRAVG